MSNVRSANITELHYVLRHSDQEIERLKEQARLIDPITQRFLREAGVIPAKDSSTGFQP